MSNALMSIPLCQLRQSEANVRKTDKLADIEQLAASIESHGLLENLIVRPIVAADHDGEPSYEVVAGARRLQALKLLRKRKKIARDFPVPCLVKEASALKDRIEFSLAENEIRAPVHPADQFEAFLKLHKEGLSAEDIAARFGLSTTLVLQRFKLAAVSTRLIAEYRGGAMTLEQLMAFTISDDQKAQETIWFESPYRDASPQTIRRLLTRSHVESYDRRARFIGANAYEEAGGVIIRDLFQPEDDGYFTDSQLLDRLVAEKLNDEAQRVKAEGWAWVEVRPETNFSELARFRRMKLVEAELPEEDEARLKALCEKYDELVSSLGDEEDAEKLAEIDKVSAEIQALEARQEQWPEETKSRAGVLLSLDGDGALRITRGLLKPEDCVTETTQEESTEETPRSEKEPGEPRGYPESLLTDLSAHRTMALREMLAGLPEQALTALLFSLVRRSFYDPFGVCCVNVRPLVLDLGATSETVGESKAAAAFLARRNRWLDRLPEPSALWSWLEAASLEEKLELLAFCTAFTVDAVDRPRDENNAERLEQANRLVQALGLDMADWWRLTAKGFFERLTKEQILSAVAEGASQEAADALAHLKKVDMAARAEGLLKDGHWLPAVFRSEDLPKQTAHAASAE